MYCLNKKYLIHDKVHRKVSAHPYKTFGCSRVAVHDDWSLPVYSGRAELDLLERQKTSDRKAPNYCDQKRMNILDPQMVYILIKN